MKFFNVIKKLKELLEAEPFITTVTEGGIDDVDLNKQSLFPLAHMIVNNAIVSDNSITFNISLIAMDIVDYSSKETTDDFRGNDNEQDVLDAMLVVLTRVLNIIRRSNIGIYAIEDDVVCEPFVERFENNLAGWTATLDIIVGNDISIC